MPKTNSATKVQGKRQTLKIKNGKEASGHLRSLLTQKQKLF